MYQMFLNSNIVHNGLVLQYRLHNQLDVAQSVCKKY